MARRKGLNKWFLPSQKDSTKTYIHLLGWSVRGAEKAEVNIVAKKFEDVTQADLPEGRRLFLFLFNVFPYIEDALALQKKLARPGDIVIVSGWNNESFEARRLQDIYYEHLGREFTCNLHDDATNGYIDGVQKQAAEFADTASRVKGRTTDILALKVK